MPDIDYEALDIDGFVVLPGLITGDEINRFESTLSAFCSSQLERFSINKSGRDPLIDLFGRSESYRALLFPMMRNLLCIQHPPVSVGRFLERSGLFAALGFKVPAVWSYLRVDPPNEAEYLLPLHQDYVTTRCAKALRIWLPLRDVGPDSGTMRIAVGSHCQGPLQHNTDMPGYLRLPDDVIADRDIETFSLAARDAVLMNPLVVHSSVMNRGDRMKIVMLVQIQDLSTIQDPEDSSDPSVIYFNQASFSRDAAQAHGKVKECPNLDG